MRLCKRDLLLYIITDRKWLKEKTIESQIEKSIKSGVRFVQVREKDSSIKDFIEIAKKVKTITDKYRIPLVINDSIEVAIKVNSDGIHIGQEDGSVEKAREELGAKKIIGVSAKTVEQAVEAEKKGADYIGVGPVYKTITKDDSNIVSYTELRNICRSVSIPVVAIGGITENNILELSGSGIEGVAVISAILSKKNIDDSTKRLLELSKKMVSL